MWGGDGEVWGVDSDGEVSIVGATARSGGDSEVEAQRGQNDQVPFSPIPWTFCDAGCEGVLYGPHAKRGRLRGSFLAPDRCTRNPDKTCFGG